MSKNKEILSVNYPIRMTPSMAEDVKRLNIQVGPLVRPVVAQEILMCNNVPKVNKVSPTPVKIINNPLLKVGDKVSFITHNVPTELLYGISTIKSITKSTNGSGKRIYHLENGIACQKKDLRRI